MTTRGVSQDREETAGNSSTGDTDTGMEEEEQGRTEERTEICAGTTTGVSHDREETAVSSRTEDPDTVIEDEGEGGTEERTELRRYVLGHRSWQPTHTRRTKIAL